MKTKSNEPLPLRPFPSCVIRHSNLVLALLLLPSAFCLSARAQGTAFTYQGRLNDGGGAATRLYDLRFALFDAFTVGNQMGSPLTNSSVNVSNGLFTVTLDFGNQFPGADRWLEIGVRTHGGGAFTALTPRQALTSTPYAIRAANYSGTVAASQLTGAISSNNIGAGSISSGMLAAGAVTTGALAEGAVTAAKVAATSNWFALTIPDPTPAFGDFFGASVAPLGSDRLLIGASGLVLGRSGAGYLFRTDGTLLTTFVSPSPRNNDLFGISLATIASDRVLIGAPLNDLAGPDAGAAYLFRTNGTLLATFTNPVPAANSCFGGAVAVSGNDRLLINASGIVLPGLGGQLTTGAAYLFSTNGVLLATYSNPTPASLDGFGYSLAAVGSDRVLVGAVGDSVGAPNCGAAYLLQMESFAPGLVADAVRPRAITTASLEDHAVTVAKLADGAITREKLVDGAVTVDKLADGAVTDIKLGIISTAGKVADSALSANVALLDRGSVQSFTSGIALAGGSAGPALDFSGTRSGGFSSPIAYGQNNNTSGASSPSLRLVGLGGNAVDGVLSVSTLGTGDLAAFGNAFAFVSRLSTNGTWTALAFTPTSDRAAKENFSPVDPQAVLEKVAVLPLARWNYKAAPGAEHMGPVAQDFHAAFGLNGGDDKHIATVDADGVALAAIQGLNQKLEDAVLSLRSDLKSRDAENAELKQRLGALEQIIFDRKPH